MKRLIGSLFILLVASTAFPQSLVEIAKKEKERRAQIASEPSRTITDAELAQAGGSATASSRVEDANAAAESSEDGETLGGPPPAEEAPEDPTQTREYWQNRLNAVDARIATHEARLREEGEGFDPRLVLERQRAEQSLAAARSERQRIEQEGRRQGVPPGWLR